MSIVAQHEPTAQVSVAQVITPPEHLIDLREQLVNRGERGPIQSVSVPEVTITRLRGIMLDFDPGLYKPEKLPPGALDDPENLYAGFVGPMLERHPVYAKAEVRDTGRGLHAILWFDPPVEFETQEERMRWSKLVKIVQKALPTDPAAPGITATTRPVGSVNGRTGRSVRVLKEGKPVTKDEILELVAEIAEKPFKLVADILLDPASPQCPVCVSPESRLAVMDTFGSCYQCKRQRLKVGDLFDAFFAPRSGEKEAAR